MFKHVMNFYVNKVKNVFQKHGYVMDQLIVELMMIQMKHQIVVCS
jgi:peptidase E